jgi:hypothetical protein
MPRYWVIAPYSFEEPGRWDRVWKYDLEHNVISIGWRELGDGSSLDEDQLKEQMDRNYPDLPSNTRTLYRRMFRDFYHSIKVGDVVLARRGRKVIAATGTVTRAAYYEHNKNLEALGPSSAYSNHLDVQWKPAPRDKAFPAVVFGMQTLYEIPEEKFRYLLEHEPWRDAQPQDLLDEGTSQLEQTAEPSNEPKPFFEPFKPLTIGTLRAANNAPVFVKRDWEIGEAITRMRINDYSQLPVMSTVWQVEGWVSWKSIGLAGGTCRFIRDCIDDQVVKLWDDYPLLDAVETISEKEVVLIQSRNTKEIIGLVTISDLGPLSLSSGAILVDW